MDPQELNAALDEVVEDIDEGRRRPTAEVVAWLDHAIANRLGMETAGFSRQDLDDLRMDLLEIFLAGVVAERQGWKVVD